MDSASQTAPRVGQTSSTTCPWLIWELNTAWSCLTDILVSSSTSLCHHTSQSIYSSHVFSKFTPKSIFFAIKKTQMRENRKKLLFIPNILDHAGNAELGNFPLLLLLMYWLHWQERSCSDITSPETSFHLFPFLAWIIFKYALSWKHTFLFPGEG